VDITGETRVVDLIREFPYLKDYLAGYAPAFGKLTNPVMLATAGRVATLATAAEMGGVPAERLVADVRAEVERRSGDGAGSEPVGAERRAEELKAIIRDLHAGATVDAVKARFARIADEVDASEIAAMEQALISEGMPPSEVQRLCDVHVEVFRESLEQPSAEEEAELPPLPDGHPAHTYLRENVELGRIVAEARAELAALSAGGADERDSLERLRAILGRLSEVDTHYTRKENQLFPLLERHGVSGPTKVMWGLHDEIRERLALDMRAAEAGDAESLERELPRTLGMIEDMAYKEERILLPVALEELAAEEWAEMAAGEAAIGFAWIEPPAGQVDAAATSRPRQQPPEGLLPLTTGAVTLEQLDLVLRHLPVDVTFVDETGHVRYYSEGKRVFPRSPAIIGRRVQDCHPPKSVDVVMRIFDEFRYGSKDTAEFWIELHGRFVYIRYIAVRDDGGAFRGVLEVTQDATELRGLTGQKRLLDWGPE
jgi:DUF438 domain-containing protein